MMIVHDPKRIFVGTLDNLGGNGITLVNHINRHGAVAGINGGGFYDPGGLGGGGTPIGVVISEGQLRWSRWDDEPQKNVVMGFDEEGILHVGKFSGIEAINRGIKEAATFGPALILNGVPVDLHPSGVNPRTAIGQRADGAVLLLVVDGRQLNSAGARYSDLIDIFLDFGAVNAGNLDGGSSTLMVYENEIINSGPTRIPTRKMPTTFLVRKLEEG